MALMVNVFRETKLRRGGITLGDAQGQKNVLIEQLHPHDYEALYQCVGEEVTDGGTNFWWVKIRVNGQEGWVSGVSCDKTGPNNTPIRDTSLNALPKRPTVFE